MKKKTILSIMDSLEKINDSVIRNLDSGVQVSMETLVDCQDSAIAVGNEIEQQYGAAGEEAVHLLEVYCENLYQMSSKSEDFVSCRKLGKKMQKQLVQIKNHIKYDLPDDKKEVVFLPYKASMWDSLESVWRAADADPDCDAFVIPIPYFDKNPDGSFREEHYEGDLYPKDVPVTRYDEYDLEARHPDIIYIHNPYDECNHVTSVHPYFYSKNLRNFTDKLVYIPYFILGEIEPDNQAAIDGMKHFCFTPGTIYADQVVVQSENMRQIYINEYMKAAKEMGLPGEHVDRKFLEKKFLGTGSPKLDKVLNTKKEDLEIPEEWLKIIEKPDGSWKKIVFYNTSVSALLQYNEAMLRKMKSVFEMFKNNKDEVALLWRPHPLIQATIESMRPQLWEEYQKIRDRYVEEGWGIYDDSADLDRAVVLSDAYYGDGSSVVSLYKYIEKTAIIQSMNIAPNAIRHMMEWAILYNDKLYFSMMEFNGICSLDLTDGLMSIESHIEEDKRCIFRAYGKGKQRDHKLYLTPLMSDKIVIYDLQNKSYDWIELPKMDQERLRHQKSKQIIINANDIYILPRTEFYPYIVQVDENTKLVKIHDISEYCENSKDVFCNASMELDGERFLFCLHGKLYEFLYETGEIRKGEYQTDAKIRDIFVDKNGIIILENKIVFLDYNWNIIEEIELGSYGISENEKLCKIYGTKQKIYLYSDSSTEAKQVYCIDILTKELRCTNIEEEEMYFLSLIVNEKDILFVYYLNNMVHCIYEDLRISEHKVDTLFDVDKYVLSENDWIENIETTYSCLNEAELLIKDLCNL